MREFALVFLKVLLVDLFILMAMVQVFFGWPDVFNWLRSL